MSVTGGARVRSALIEMYLAEVSVRRVEDITEALWGTRVSPATVPDLNKNFFGTIEGWRNRPIRAPYAYLDGLPKRSWAGDVHNVSLLVAVRLVIGANFLSVSQSKRWRVHKQHANTKNHPNEHQRPAQYK